MCRRHHTYVRKIIVPTLSLSFTVERKPLYLTRAQQRGGKKKRVAREKPHTPHSNSKKDEREVEKRAVVSRPKGSRAREKRHVALRLLPPDNAREERAVRVTTSALPPESDPRRRCLSGPRACGLDCVRESAQVWI